MFKPEDSQTKQRFYNKSSRYKNNKPSYSNKQNEGQKNLTVILDLDNTLISSFILSPNSSICDFLFTLQDFPEMIGVVKRPNVDSFLMKLSSIATIYLFTSAEREYATKIVNEIDPMGIYFTKIFTRENCIQIDDKKYKKDYSICKTNMSRTLIVDDIPDNFKDYAKNGISVCPYNGGIEDNDLVRVLQKITNLSGLIDVRTGISTEQKFISK